MDIKQYFNPVNFTFFTKKIAGKWKYSLGRDIDKSTGKFTVTNIQNVDVVILGIPCFEGIWDESKIKSINKIREELYSLANFSGTLNIVDLGNLKSSTTTKGTYLALRDITEFFSELNIVTLILGGSSDLCAGICDAFSKEIFFTFSSIDAQLDVKKGRESFGSSNYLTHIFMKTPNLFQFNLLGYQRHLVAPELFLKTNEFGNHLSLGEIHDDIKKAEPVLRNTNILAFDIRSVKSAEIASNNHTNPNGLQSDEMCQLAKYAGMSNNLKVFGLFETDTKKDRHGITYKLISQIVWYFFEGLTFRKNDRGVTGEKVLSYEVEIDGLEKPLKFLFCENSGRWWFEIQSFNNEKYIIACSEKEYNKALNNEIPDFWLNCVQKIDSILK
ncbi:MAG: arginase family protein [Bacteroidales bacterium]|jgi:arginase family enzyme|nr:arginase family protein [Bacteroidales bacterium]